jgi:hypothetical protein
MLSSMRYRVRENVTKTYSDAQGECVVEGTMRCVLRSHPEPLEEVGSVTLFSERTPSTCGQEWLRDMEVRLMRRCTVSITHCVSAVFDAFSDGTYDSRVLCVVSEDVAHQIERVSTLIGFLQQGSEAEASLRLLMTTPGFLGLTRSRRVKKASPKIRTPTL